MHFAMNNTKYSAYINSANKCDVKIFIFTLKQLKGLTGEDMKHKLEKLLNLLGLLHKRDHFVCKLSGGMKRKLSLAMALVGDPEVNIIEF